MPKIDTSTSQVLNLLRLPLAFLIVAGHANTLKFPLYSGENVMIYDYDIIMYPIHLLSQIIFAPAVPLFFMISGYLFFWDIEIYDIPKYKHKISRRIKTLLIPYLIWNMLYLIPLMTANFLKDKDYSLWLLIENLWVCPDQSDRIPQMILATPVDPPLWFIRDLMVCMAISPLIWIVLKNKWSLVVTLITLSFLYFSSIPVQYPFPGFSVISILFFSIGSAISIHKTKISLYLDGKICAYMVTIIFVILSAVELTQIDYLIIHGQLGVEVKIVQDDFLHKMVQLFGCFAFISLAYRIVNNVNVSNIKMGGAFCVFAVHWILLEITRRAIKYFCPVEVSQIEALFLYLLLIIIGFGGGLVINYIITKNKYILQLFAGGRS